MPKIYCWDGDGNPDNKFNDGYPAMIYNPDRATQKGIEDCFDGELEDMTWHDSAEGAEKLVWCPQPDIFEAEDVDTAYQMTIDNNIPRAKDWANILGLNPGDPIVADEYGRYVSLDWFDKYLNSEEAKALVDPYEEEPMTNMLKEMSSLYHKILDNPKKEPQAAIGEEEQLTFDFD